MLRTKGGELLFAEEEIASELVHFWSSVIKPTEATMEDRKQYISDIPRQWRGGGGGGRGKCCGPTLTSKWCWQPCLSLTHPEHQGWTGS